MESQPTQYRISYWHPRYRDLRVVRGSLDEIVGDLDAWYWWTSGQFYWSEGGEELRRLARERIPNLAVGQTWKYHVQHTRRVAVGTTITRLADDDTQSPKVNGRCGRVG